MSDDVVRWETEALREVELPRYRIRSGDLDRSGSWQQGSYDEFFHATDFGAAKDEADRALRNNEIRGTEKGDVIRVDGLGGSAWRSVGQNCDWYKVNAECR